MSQIRKEGEDRCPRRGGCLCRGPVALGVFRSERRPVGLGQGEVVLKTKPQAQNVITGAKDNDTKPTFNT